MNRNYDRYMLREAACEPDAKQKFACNTFYGLGFGARDMNEAADRECKAIQKDLDRKRGFSRTELSSFFCGSDWFWIACCVVAIFVWIGD